MKKAAYFFVSIVAISIVLIILLDLPPFADSQKSIKESDKIPTTVHDTSIKPSQVNPNPVVASLPPTDFLDPNLGRDAEIREIGLHKTTSTISKNSTFYQSMKKLGVSPKDIIDLVEVSKSIKNLARMNRGTEITLHWEDETLEKLLVVEIPLKEDAILKVEKTQDKFNKNPVWKAEKVQLHVEFREFAYFGEVTVSLWESASKVQLAGEVINQLAEIFAWQVDFSREVRVGDTWKILVQKKYVEGNLSGWGNIIAAEYDNNGYVYRAARFQSDGEQPSGYYEPDGSSMQRMFLKAPIKFARISSKFSRNRFHPVLKVPRPHLGVDYAAAIGTPVMATGDGRITFRGWKGGGGKTIKIRHNAIYTTAYKHLNGYNKKFKRGSTVKQGQIIGYVGTTGLSTGPHLHYEFFKHGKFVDPLKEKFPSATPLPEQYVEDFKKFTSLKFQLLDRKITIAKKADEPAMAF